MLFLLGIGLFDLINTEDFSLQSFRDKLTIIIVAILFKFSKSIFLLNIYYISSISILVVSAIINELYSAINLSLIFSLSILFFLVNKFKYNKIHYENIELIGKHSD